MELFIFIAIIVALIASPVVSMHLFLKKRNKELQEPCTKYKRIKARRKLRKDIYEALVTESYDVNHLHWYTFKLPDNEIYTMGIVEVVGAFGDDIFKKAQIERDKRLDIKNENLQHSYVTGL